MPTSQNGWSASPNLPLRPLVVGGISFVPGVRDDDDVHTVLGYVLEQYDKRVEPLVNPGCWGFAYRENRNDPNNLSNHASGTAVDANAPQHPNGVPTRQTFTQGQIDEVHRILGEVDHVIRWGGDYTGTPDAMHFEVNVNKATLHGVAVRLREEDDVLNAQDKEWIERTIERIVHAEIKKAPDTIKFDVGQKAKWSWNTVAKRWFGRI